MKCKVGQNECILKVSAKFSLPMQNIQTENICKGFTEHNVVSLTMATGKQSFKIRERLSWSTIRKRQN